MTRTQAEKCSCVPTAAITINQNAARGRRSTRSACNCKTKSAVHSGSKSCAQTLREKMIPQGESASRAAATMPTKRE